VLLTEFKNPAAYVTREELFALPTAQHNLSEGWDLTRLRSDGAGSPDCPCRRTVPHIAFRLDIAA